jgi:hypothetical protein
MANGQRLNETVPTIVIAATSEMTMAGFVAC